MRIKLIFSYFCFRLRKPTLTVGKLRSSGWLFVRTPIGNELLSFFRVCIRLVDVVDVVDVVDAIDAVDALDAVDDRSL